MMSKIAALVVVAGLLASHPSAAVNLLANPGFQAGGNFQLNYDDAVLDGPAPPIAQVPALDGRGLALLALLLSAAALLILARR